MARKARRHSNIGIYLSGRTKKQTRCSKRCGCRDLLYACPYKSQEWRCGKRCGCRDLLHACPNKSQEWWCRNVAAVGTCFMHVRTKAKNGGAHIFIGRAQDPPLRLLETIWRSDMHEASPYDFWGIPTPPIIDARFVRTKAKNGGAANGAAGKSRGQVFDSY